MDSREFEFLQNVIKERQSQLLRDLEVEALLAETRQGPDIRRQVVVSLVLAAVLLVVIVASSAHLFI